MARHDTGKDSSQVNEALNLKICDLCGALNVVSEFECVVCRWHGHFERRPEVVRIALELHMQRRMDSDLRNDGDFMEDRIGGFGGRVRRLWNGLVRWLLPRRF